MKLTLISAAAFAMFATAAFAKAPTNSKIDSQPAASQERIGSTLLAGGPNRKRVPFILTGGRSVFG